MANPAHIQAREIGKKGKEDDDYNVFYSKLVEDDRKLNERFDLKSYYNNKDKNIPIELLGGLPSIKTKNILGTDIKIYYDHLNDMYNITNGSGKVTSYTYNDVEDILTPSQLKRLTSLFDYPQISDVIPYSRKSMLNLKASYDNRTLFNRNTRKSMSEEQKLKYPENKSDVYQEISMDYFYDPISKTTMFRNRNGQYINDKKSIDDLRPDLQEKIKKINIWFNK
jgi:hypothetical protein